MASVLTVDDSPSIRQAIKIALGGAGHDVVEAGDGADGVAKASAGAFSLIITDLNMPVMNGIAMIRELRKLPQCTGMPIIFLTTESAANMKQEAKAAGATGWIAGLVNAFPEESVRLFRLARSGPSAELDTFYSWFLPLLRLDTVPKFVQLIKQVQEECGGPAARVRPPRLELAGAERDEVVALTRRSLANCPR